VISAISFERRVPDEPAIIVANSGAALYRRDLAALVGGAARRLRRHVAPHEIVAVPASLGLEQALAILIAFETARVALVSHSATAHELQALWLRERPDAVLTWAGAPPTHYSAAGVLGIPIMELSWEGAAGQSSIGLSPISHKRRNGQSRPVGQPLLVATSGSTGDPKLVALSRELLIIGAQRIIDTVRLSSADIALSVMPMFHTHGLLSGLIVPLISGGTVVLLEDWNAREIPRVLERFEVTWYSSSPPVHRATIRAIENRGRRLTISLRAVRSASAPLDPDLWTRVERVTGATVLQAYALTEDPGQLTSTGLQRERGDEKTVGRPSSGVALRIERDDLGGCSDVGIGEVLIHRRNCASDVSSSATPASRATEDWVRTGDLGGFDADGRLVLAGRLADLINRGGEKVSPVEVEGVLRRHLWVRDVVVFPVQHASLGEDVAAAVVWSNKTRGRTEDLRQFAAQFLSAYKVPRAILTVDAIPTSATGKVVRRGLAVRLGLQH
jgi:acyl-CoA synthetase (AMP-forming)/AMP-acid ligase II